MSNHGDTGQQCQPAGFNWPALRKAMDFYKKQGFAEGGRIKNFYEDGSDQIYMHKELK